MRIIYNQTGLLTKNGIMTTNCLESQGWNPGKLMPFSEAQLAPSHMMALQRVWRRRFSMARMVLVLASMLAVFLGFSPQSHAAVVLTAGGGSAGDTVAPGGTLTIPIYVSGFSGLKTLQFSLTWDNGMLSYQTHGPADTAIGGFPTFGPLTPVNTLTFAWVNTSPQTLADGSALFTVSFTAGSSVGSTALNFGGTIKASDASGVVSVTTVADQIMVAVPEPVNWALGLFACVFIGGTTVRWVANRRPDLPPAQTATDGSPGA
jgi:hypothetical protein